MKIALCSAVWGRLPLTRVWWKGISRIRERFAEERIESRAFISGSEAEHQDLCRVQDGVWSECGNGKLGEKWNCAVRAGLAWGADHIFILGSDDFFSDALIKQYARLIYAGTPFVSLDAIYVHEVSSNRTLLLDTNAQKTGSMQRLDDSEIIYRYHHADGSKRRTTRVPNEQMKVGAGRLIQRSYFEGFTDFWDASRAIALDLNMVHRLSLPAPLFVIHPHGFALDVKTGENIWSFDRLLSWFPTALRPDAGVLTSLPEWDDIRALTSPESRS